MDIQIQQFYDFAKSYIKNPKEAVYLVKRTQKLM